MGIVDKLLYFTGLGKEMENRGISFKPLQDKSVAGNIRINTSDTASIFKNNGVRDVFLSDDHTDVGGGIRERFSAEIGTAEVIGGPEGANVLNKTLEGELPNKDDLIQLTDKETGEPYWTRSDGNGGYEEYRVFKDKDNGAYSVGVTKITTDDNNNQDVDFGLIRYKPEQPVEINFEE